MVNLSSKIKAELMASGLAVLRRLLITEASRWQDGQYRTVTVFDWWCPSCHKALDQSMGDHAICPACGNEYVIEEEN